MMRPGNFRPLHCLFAILRGGCLVRRSPSVFVIVALVVCGVQGCGKRSDKLAVTGEVKLNGAPLEDGSIKFTSLGGEAVISSGAMVQNGRYEVPQQHGLKPGKYHVSISAPDPKAPPVMRRATPGGPAIPVAPDRIPPEFNSKSKQEVEVTGDGDNHFVFNIGGQSG
jgi:hypothetical protein